MADQFTEDLIALLPAMKRYALSLCRNGDFADELVQIAAERALRGRDSYDPVIRLEAWVLRILRNAWIDAGRRRKTRGVEVDVDHALDLAGADGARDVEARLALKETAAALSELPPEQREAVTLVCLQGLSYKEAAAVLDAPTGTVMSRLARGRAALAKTLGIE